MSLFVTAGSSGRSDKRALDRGDDPGGVEAGEEIERGPDSAGPGAAHDRWVGGVEEFVNEVFTQHREKFGAQRKDGARKIRGVPLEGLRVLRDLQVRTLG